MSTVDLDLTKRERLARILGRKDVLMELAPLLAEAGELAERMASEPEQSTGEELLHRLSSDRAAAMRMIARICGYALSAGQELEGEIRLAKAAEGPNTTG